MTDRLSKNPAYRRLPTGRRTTGQHLSCWLAHDHLLVVEVSGYTERYSRFQLQDVQAVVLKPTPARAYVAIAAAVVLLIVLALIASLWVANNGPDPVPGFVFLGLLAAAPMSALLWAAWCGPLCSIRISTAVQVAALPALHNLIKARAFALALREATLGSQPGPGHAPQPTSDAARP